jgi:hypothetical protein
VLCTWAAKALSKSSAPRTSTAEPIVFSLCPSEFDHDILSLHVAEVVERFTEVVRERLRRVPSIPYPGELRRLLRLSGERRHEDGEGEGDEKPDKTACHGNLLG